MLQATPKSDLFGPQEETEKALRLFVEDVQNTPLCFLGRTILRGMLRRILLARCAPARARPTLTACTPLTAQPASVAALRGGHRKNVMDYVVQNPKIAEVRRAWPGACAVPLAARSRALGARRVPRGNLAQLPIRKPLIVLGLPRTGSTLMYNLLACDPETRAPMFWEMIHFIDPAPPAPQAAHATDPRIDKVNARFRTLDVLAPGMIKEMSKSHVTKAYQYDEELIAMMHQMQLIMWAPMAPKKYEDWVFEAGNKRQIYVYLKRFIQMLQSAWAPKSHWVLKSPVHALYLDAILEQFPDARIVVTHRELESVVPSLARYIESMTSYYFDDATLSRLELGRLAGRLTDEVTNRMIEFRRKHKQPEQFCDVQYSKLISDPIGVVRDVYAHFGMTVTPEHEAAIRKYMDDNPQGKHGRQSYDIADYGFTKDALKKRYNKYLETYLSPAK